MTTSKQVSELKAGHTEVPGDASADLKGSLVAIRRAAAKARQYAAQTGTDLIVSRAGKIVRVSPQLKDQQ